MPTFSATALVLSAALLAMPAGPATTGSDTASESAIQLAGWHPTDELKQTPGKCRKWCKGKAQGCKQYVRQQAREQRQQNPGNTAAINAERDKRVGDCESDGDSCQRQCS